MDLNKNIDRRKFLKAAAVAGAGVPLAVYLPGCGTSTETTTVTKTMPAIVSTATATATTTVIHNATTTITPPTVTTTKVSETTVTTPPPPATTSKAPAVVPARATVVDAAEGTELMLQAVAAQGVKKIFFCGGTDNFHWMEYVAKFKALGRPTPDIVTAVYEQTGIYLQMGYFDWTRKPQLTVLHVALGTAAGGAGWDTLKRGFTGAVVLAGIVGQTTKNETGYTNRGGVQFQQEVIDQLDILKNYAKWQYKIERVENAALIINRAYQVAGTEPCGISYLTYPMEVAEAPLTGGLAYDPADFACGCVAQGDVTALDAAAKMLVQAKNPVIMVSRMGRHPEAVAALVALAEKISCPVAPTSIYMNFPKTHWANSGASLSTRDVVLAIDHETFVTSTDPPKTCKIITMNEDPMGVVNPMNGVPSNLPITCNSALAIPVLTQLCDNYITAERRTAFAERKAALEAAFKTSQDTAKANIEKAKTASPLSGTWIRECVNQVTDENTVLLWDIGSIGQGDKSQPGHVFAQPGPSLGSSWARGIGIKMASQDAGQNKLVISDAGDGCTMFSGPVSCLMASRMYKAPTLHIVNNNNRYNAVQGGLSGYGGANSYAAKSGYNGSALKPSPDFAGIAKAVGAYGEKVTDPAVLPAALQRAIAAVKGGQAAVLDTVIVQE